MNDPNDKERIRVQIRIEPDLARKLDKLKDERGYSSRNILINDLLESCLNEENIVQRIDLMSKEVERMNNGTKRNEQKLEYMLATIFSVLSSIKPLAPEQYDEIDEVITQCLREKGEVTAYRFKNIGKERGAWLSTPEQKPVVPITPVNTTPVSDDALYQRQKPVIPVTNTQSAVQQPNVNESSSREDKLKQMASMINDKIKKGIPLSEKEKNVFEYLYSQYPERFDCNRNDVF